MVLLCEPRTKKTLLMQQTLVHVEGLKESQYYEELVEPSGLEAQKHHPKMIEETKTIEEMKLSTIRERSSEFTLAEVMKMEKAFKGMKETSLKKEYCQYLATQLSCSRHRYDKSSIKWQQVRVWFQERQKQEAAKSVTPSNVTRYRNSSKKLSHDSTHIYYEAKCPKIKMGRQTKPKDENGSSSKKLSNYSTLISSETKCPKLKIGSQTKPKEKSAVELNELLMEAKSSRDSSWYDVGTFLNHKVTADGEIKARVRFAGFDNSHDEWVNVKREIRQRSIPLQETECHLVQVGDLVLCFRKRGHSDLYFDAHVTKIERNFHDLQGCKCIFLVCYDHDNYQEAVCLGKLCRRPSQ